MLDFLEVFAIPLEIFEGPIEKSLCRSFLRLQQKVENRALKKIT